MQEVGGMICSKSGFLQHGHTDQSPTRTRLGILYQLSGVAGWMPRIGDQIVYMIDHISVCSDDSKSPWDLFHIRRIVCAVESVWYPDGALCWMIWKKEGQSDLLMLLFRFYNSVGGETVKTSIVSNNKLCHVIFNDVSFNSFFQGRKKLC